MAPAISHLERGDPQYLPRRLSNFNGTDPKIAQLYREVLNRDPDATGGAALTNALINGAQLESLRAQMVDGDEGQLPIRPLTESMIDSMSEMKIGSTVGPTIKLVYCFNAHF